MFHTKQKGASPFVILVMLCAFAFVVLVGLKIAPHYLNYNSLRGIFDEALADPGSTDEDAVMTKIDKMLLINNLRDIKINEIAYFEQIDGRMIGGFEYEIKEHMFLNIDVLLTFEYESE